MESHFVKLEPPYQIIHYGGAVGIQIGTLITVGNMYLHPGNENSIEDVYTHSHPVVSYVDKKLLKTKMGKDRGRRELASYYGGGEGNVWSKVQVGDVDVIGLWDADQEEASYPFEWDDFVELVTSGFSRLDVINRTYRENGIFDLLNYLRKVGLEVVPPPAVKQLKMKLSLAYQNIEFGQVRGSLFCHAEDVALSFYQPFGENYVKNAVEIFVHFLRQYLSIMRSLDAKIEFFVGETINGELKKGDHHVAEDNLVNLVKTLNETYNEKYRMQQ
jgi:hypothetical protein